MNRSRVDHYTGQPGDERGLEGVATNIKLLLKLIEDYNGSKESDQHKIQRVNGIMSILDETRGRVQRFQMNNMKTNKINRELRRSNSDIKSSSVVIAREKTITDEKERMRRELQSSFVVRQSLQALCSSLGKEKQIMACELARKAQELAEMEELVADLKEQNEMLMKKLNSNIKIDEGGNRNNVVLHEMNRTLTHQLQISLDGYRSLKIKYMETQEENRDIHADMEEMEVQVQAGIQRLQGLKKIAEMIAKNDKERKAIKDQILALEQLLASLHMKISKYTNKT
ncbi:hypothetical protein HN51_013952 [Arachis hypogaea]|uniref:Uncharacterized protein n=1 Tax=Arachis hypogaea TaxID=3818 RepID=A0A445DN37_ARAHY|nr:uncharacterized protein LOC107631708 [Arachis ipaensis]XP_025639375.1 uncharacterized protein LOC112734331 [Arachis hypogaea]QHO59800.1 uncharacterized protein DS421_3g102050 [Arachis hypogaea]RYR64583.1 hypothetical protein Ahy_A03g010659 [Arachis hypogaea]